MHQLGLPPVLTHSAAAPAAAAPSDDVAHWFVLAAVALLVVVLVRWLSPGERVGDVLPTVGSLVVAVVAVVAITLVIVGVLFALRFAAGIGS
jgi:hypothetical protein